MQTEYGLLTSVYFRRHSFSGTGNLRYRLAVATMFQRLRSAIAHPHSSTWRFDHGGFSVRNERAFDRVVRTDTPTNQQSHHGVGMPSQPYHLYHQFHIL